VVKLIDFIFAWEWANWPEVPGAPQPFLRSVEGLTTIRELIPVFQGLAGRSTVLSL